MPAHSDVIGFDDIEEAGLLERGLATVAIDAGRIGAEAARLLLERIENPDAVARRIILPPRLVLRESCAATPCAAHEPAAFTFAPGQ